MLIFLILAAVVLSWFLLRWMILQPYWPANPFEGLSLSDAPRALCGLLQAAVKGKGAKFWLWDSSLATPALVQIGELVSVTPPNRSRDTIDTTHHGSTGDYREFLSSLIDAGEVSFTVNWVPNGASDILLNAAFAAGDIRSFAVDVNTTGGLMRRVSGSGILTEFSPDEVGIEDKMTAQITLKVTGPITFGAPV